MSQNNLETIGPSLWVRLVPKHTIGACKVKCLFKIIPLVWKTVDMTDMETMNMTENTTYSFNYALFILFPLHLN